MADTIKVTTEQVDDIPVLLRQGQKIGIAELLDRHFKPHGNWQGASLGWTSLVWLAYIASEGDHRLNQVESWVEQRPHTVSLSTGQPVRSQEWSDDRLGIVLDELADAEKWQAFETDLNRRTFRVYDLKPHRVRLDSTTASGYWSVTEDGLFQFGHSKDHRPDLPQLKVMMSALDPLGMPVATQVVSGERADDPLYIPAIQQVSASLDEHGLFLTQLLQQAFHVALEQGLQTLTLQHDPVVVEAGQQFAMIERQLADQIVERSIGRGRPLELIHIEPAVRFGIERDGEVLGQQVIVVGGIAAAQYFADTPEFGAEVVARVLVGGVGPQQTGQSFAALRGAGIEEQIGQQ